MSVIKEMMLLSATEEASVLPLLVRRALAQPWLIGGISVAVGAGLLARGDGSCAKPLRLLLGLVVLAKNERHDVVVTDGPHELLAIRSGDYVLIPVIFMSAVEVGNAREDLRTGLWLDVDEARLDLERSLDTLDHLTAADLIGDD